MNKDTQMLYESIEKTHDLVAEMREDLNTRFGAIELTQQKLKFYIYGVALGGLVLLGKPELVAALIKI